ncbi:MAG: toll/interleukin-1 receptor domain-containing protein, partial [Chitinophagales bacterium]
MSTTEPIKIFIAYSRQDKSYLEKLRKHLKPLDRQRKIEIWYDGEITAGSHWEKAITDALYTADILLLLVSANSLASDYFYDKEMADALARHEQEEAIVIPIILSHCAWEITELHELQALPQDGKPIVEWELESQAYTNIVKGVYESVKVCKKRKGIKSKEVQEQTTRERAKNTLQKTQESKRLQAFKQRLLEADKAELNQEWEKAVAAYRNSFDFFQKGDTPTRPEILQKIARARKQNETPEPIRQLLRDMVVVEGGTFW